MSCLWSALPRCWWTPTAVPSGIRPVTHLYLSEVTFDSVLVAWSAPAPPADLFILSYSSSDGTDTSKVTLDGSKTRSLVQGLLPSIAYTISLITIQGDVTSEPITASLTTGELPHCSEMTQVMMNCKQTEPFSGYMLQWWHHVSSLYHFFGIWHIERLASCYKTSSIFPWCQCHWPLLNFCAFTIEWNDRWRYKQRRLKRKIKLTTIVSVFVSMLSILFVKNITTETIWQSLKFIKRLKWMFSSENWSSSSHLLTKQSWN